MRRFTSKNPNFLWKSHEVSLLCVGTKWHWLGIANQANQTRIERFSVDFSFRSQHSLHLSTGSFWVECCSCCFLFNRRDQDWHRLAFTYRQQQFFFATVFRRSQQVHDRVLSVREGSRSTETGKVSKEERPICKGWSSHVNWIRARDPGLRNLRNDLRRIMYF